MKAIETKLQSKVLITENTKNFKKGELIELAIVEEQLSKENYIILTEALTKQDEERIQKMIQDVLKRMFWRIYTRSAFITK